MKKTSARALLNYLTFCATDAPPQKHDFNLRLLTAWVTCMAWSNFAQAKDTEQIEQVFVTSSLIEFRQFNSVEITGSSILSPATKEALPIQVVTRRDIERSGVTGLPELLQSLSVMSNFQELGSVAGTVLGGPEAASIHGRQSGTLVLLNGRRLPVYGSQTIAGERAIVDLNMLPLSAVERIEILTDGASSRYGSDAIAGVVNVITRSSQTGVSIAADYIRPRGGEAQGQGLSLSWGKGKFQTDGYSLQVYLSHQKQDALKASTRPNSGNSVIPVTIAGKTLYASRGLSVYGAPATIRNPDGTYQPYVGMVNGRCPAGWYTFGLDISQYGQCHQNTQSDLTIYPKTEKTQFFTQGEIALNSDHALFGELLMGQATQVTSFSAPDTFEQDFDDGTTALARSTSLGPVIQRYTNDNYRFTVGSKGRVEGWDYVSSVYQGAHSVKKDFLSGLFNADPEDALTKDELLHDPSTYSAATLAKFANHQNSNFWLDKGKSKLQAVETIASKTLADLDNGPVQLGIGASFYQESFYYNSYSDEERPKFGGSRKVGALHGELGFPVTENTDATTSLRQDHYSDFGGATTGKLGAKWKPAPEWLFRGSVGTGFRAPTLSQMSDVTSPFAYTHDRLTDRDVDIVYKGNPKLQPETSRQASVGARWEPSQRFSIGADLWHLKVENTFGRRSLDRLLSSPLREQYLQTGPNGDLFIDLVNSNLGAIQKKGVDYDVQWRMPADIGRIWLALKGTYMLESKTQPEAGLPFESDLARYSDISRAYTPKHSVRLTGGLENAGWSTSASVNYLSGNTEVFDLYDMSGGVMTAVPRVERKVPGYWTLDLGGRWQVNRQVTLIAGLINARDTNPPLRLNTSGLLMGIDTRYASAYGRTLKLRLEAKF